MKSEQLIIEYASNGITFNLLSTFLNSLYLSLAYYLQFGVEDLYSIRSELMLILIVYTLSAQSQLGIEVCDLDLFNLNAYSRNLSANF